MPSSLVIGGAGRTGRHIVDGLRRDGAAVKVLSRNPDRVPDGVEAITGDITRPDSVAAAMRGVVRPSWLTDDPGGRQALRRGKTFELYGEPGEPPTDRAPLFAGLR